MTAAEVIIDKMAAGGDALGHLSDGRVVFVSGALPGERVAVQVVQSKRDFARARLLEVIAESPHRSMAPCPELARGCGGCDWQHVQPAAQIELKADIVKDALRRTARLPSADVRVGGSVPSVAYRTTMRVASAPDGRLGLRAAASNQVVALGTCLVVHDRLVDLLTSIRSSQRGDVQLRVSEATEERSAWVIGSEGPGRLTGAPVGTALGPDGQIHERVGPHLLSVSAASFFQSGPAAASLLVDRVAAAVGDVGDRHLVDAYGGVGLLALGLEARRITLIESNPWACADAALNLAGRHAVIRNQRLEDWTPEPADVMVADPARAGLGAAAVERLAATGASELVLVSCDPVAMARDAALLGERGYRLDYAEVVDLFPHTHHVEVVGRYTRS